jgi:hypothetical protein
MYSSRRSEAPNQSPNREMLQPPTRNQNRENGGIKLQASHGGPPLSAVISKLPLIEAARR